MYSRKMVDLHGYQSDEIIGIIYNLLYQFKNDNGLELLFITGHGVGSIKHTLLSILEQEKINYQEINNGGAFLVKHESMYTTSYYLDFEDFEDNISYEDLEEIFEEFKE